MVKGETFNLQLFESEAFRHFINVFTNKQSGVTLGCEVTRDTQNITVGQGYFFIQGGLLRETTGTANAIPSDAGYYKLVYEINLSKTNTEDQFNQGSYKFIKSLGSYPELTQQDLDNGGTIYQLPFCQFRITEQGLQDFKDITTIIDYGIYIKKPVLLWQGNTNDMSSIILSDEVSNYSKIKIFFHDNNDQRTNIEIDNSDKSNEIPTSLSSFYNQGGWFNVKMRSIILSGNKIQAVGQASYEFTSKEIIYNNNIAITKIEGYL